MKAVLSDLGHYMVCQICVLCFLPHCSTSAAAWFCCCGCKMKMAEARARSLKLLEVVLQTPSGERGPRGHGSCLQGQGGRAGRPKCRNLELVTVAKPWSRTQQKRCGRARALRTSSGRPTTRRRPHSPGAWRFLQTSLQLPTLSLYVALAGAACRGRMRQSPSP